MMVQFKALLTIHVATTVQGVHQEAVERRVTDLFLTWQPQTNRLIWHVPLQLNIYWQR